MSSGRGAPSVKMRGITGADWEEVSEAVDAIVEKVEDLASFLAIVAVWGAAAGGGAGVGNKKRMTTRIVCGRNSST